MSALAAFVTTTYIGRVVSRDDRRFPFAVELTTSDGRLVATYPVRTLAEGDAKLVLTIHMLREADSKFPAMH